MNIASTWFTLYPDICEHIVNSLSTLQSDRRNVWDVFTRFTGLTDDGADRVLNSRETLPSLWFRDLGGNIDGYFRPSNPQMIEINTLVAEKFQEAAIDPVAQEYVIALVLHETVHWALHPNEPRDREMGVEFEKAAFGQKLERFWTDGSRRWTPPRSVVRLATTPEDRAERDFKNSDLTYSLPRGIRNNNPGNIKRGQLWEGLAGDASMLWFQRRERTFDVFKEPVYGIRAAARTLRTYKTKHHLNTPMELIRRWAPAHDNNNPIAYAQFVADAIGVAVDDRIDTTEEQYAIPLLEGIIRFENDRMQPYSERQLREGFNLATSP